MRRLLIGIGIAAVLLWATPDATVAQLFSDDFEVDPTANWTFNPGPIAADPSDHAADFFFDYSTVGIPLAPNSEAGGTRGMNLQANRDGLGIGAGVFSGMSVSPTGEDFSGAGDYVLKFDWWQNFPGPFPAGSSGTSQLSTFGIGTSGTVANWPGALDDGLYFAATLDGGSSSDYRAYSVERPFSYQLPYLNPDTDIDGLGNPIDSHATYHAGGRNHSANPADHNFNSVVDAADYTIYRDNLGRMGDATQGTGDSNFDTNVDQADYDKWVETFGSRGLYRDNFGGVSAPQAQIDLYPQQTGEVLVGATGMTWHEVEIAKIGNSVTWTVDGILLMTVDMTNFVSPLGGGNILFGQSDINSGASSDPLRFELLFTLIDNIVVEVIPSEGSAAVGGSTVPEPAAWCLAMIGLALCGVCRRARN